MACGPAVPGRLALALAKAAVLLLLLLLLLATASGAAVAAAAGTCASSPASSPWTVDVHHKSWLRRDGATAYCLEIAQPKGACDGSTSACCSDAGRPVSLTVSMDPTCGLDSLKAIKWTVDGKKAAATVGSDGTVELANLGRWKLRQTSKLVCATMTKYAKCHNFDTLCPGHEGHRCAYTLANEAAGCCRAALTKRFLHIRPTNPLSAAMVAAVTAIEGAMVKALAGAAAFRAEFTTDPAKAAAGLPPKDARLAAEVARAAALPAAYDSRGVPTAAGPKSVLTPVRYQEHCDACIAFATTAAAEAAFLKAHLDAGQPLEPATSQWFSPYVVYWCTHKLKAGWRNPFQRKYSGQNSWCWNVYSNADGTGREVSENADMLLSEAVGLVLKTGFVADSCRPYTTHTGGEILQPYGANRSSQTDINAACRQARTACKRHNTGFSQVLTRYAPPQAGGTQDASALAFYSAVKERIMASGGVVAQLQLYNDLYDYIDTTAPYRRSAGDQLIGGHGVLVVGWDDARGVWVVKNSWSARWGDQGYGYIAYDAGVSLFGSADDAADYPEAYDLPYSLAAAGKAAEDGGDGGGSGGGGSSGHSGGARTGAVAPWAVAAASAPSARQEAGGCVTHTVMAGQSLAGIAAAMDVPVGTLLNDNQGALKGAADLAFPAAGTVLLVCKHADCAATAECRAGAECRPNPFRGGQGECR